MLENRIFAWNMAAACYNAGVGEITHRNFDEFWKRYCAFQLSIGGFLYVTKEEASKCVGFSTNVETLTHTKFTKRVMENVMRNGEILVKPAPSFGHVDA